MDRSQEVFERLFSGASSEDEGRDFLISLYEKGESSAEIAAAAKVMRKHSIKLPISDELREKAIDIVGTGGDKSGTFNISTTVSLLLSSLGCVVAKHGNRSITSCSGSADVLEALGINLGLTPVQNAMMLEQCGFCFMFAPEYHPAMKHIMPIRRSISHRTIFNILGPLTNPAGVKKYLLGVFDESFINPIAEAMLALDITRAYVVSSRDKTDEISLCDDTDFAYIEAGKISRGVIDPNVYGFKKVAKEEILGGDAEHNAMIIRDIFNQKEVGAKRDIVLLNAAFALFIEGMARDIQHGIELAKGAIENGKATVHLARIIALSNTL
ncbi:MAG: anthranilate phosphoribosyltransferase [Campylobacterales bacterium]|nr:anthranilate phosphoribosyltransferase [Campylobacterales bacterium]